MRSAVIITCLFMAVSISNTWANEAPPPPSWWHQASLNAQKDGYRLIKPNELQALRSSGENFLLVDVRPGYEYCQGHLPNAINMEFDLGDQLSLSNIKKSDLVKVLGPNKMRLIVIYCRSFR
jgi:phage shock protein E